MAVYALASRIRLTDLHMERLVISYPGRTFAAIYHADGHPGQLQEMAASQVTYLFFARLPDEHGQIVGSATLGVYRTPTGLHAWIEDVIVDRSARRLGVGRALTEACLEQARVLGLREVNLTSRSARCAANLLYQAMGFIRRETNLYRYPLQD